MVEVEGAVEVGAGEADEEEKEVVDEVGEGEGCDHSEVSTPLLALSFPGTHIFAISTHPLLSHPYRRDFLCKPANKVVHNILESNCPDYWRITACCHLSYQVQPRKSCRTFSDH